MTAVQTRLVRARTSHRCGTGASCAVAPGDLYLLHTEYPGGESGYADAAGHPVRMAECFDCAVRYGRGDLFSEAS